MRRFFLFLAFGLTLGLGPAFADDMALLGVGNQKKAATSSYTGPGDILTYSVWHGVRGVSGAFASPGTGKSINVRRASDNVAQDIVVLSNGNLDVASYNTFVGTDATASCTIAATAMACTGASATLHINDLITGVGITKPCIVTATNGSTTATVVIGGGTSTSCGTVSVAETVTFQVAGLLPKEYDQIAANDSVQATAGSQPQLFPDCGNALPCVGYNGTSSFFGATVSNTAQPWSISLVAERVLVQKSEYLNTGGWFVQPNGAATLNTNFGANLNTSPSDSVLHAFNILGSGASSVVNIDGTETTGNPGAAASGTSYGVGASNGGGSFFLGGYEMEEGIIASATTTTTRNNTCHNQRLYWGSAGAC